MMRAYKAERSKFSWRFQHEDSIGRLLTKYDPLTKIFVAIVRFSLLMHVTI